MVQVKFVCSLPPSRTVSSETTGDEYFTDFLDPFAFAYSSKIFVVSDASTWVLGATNLWRRGHAPVEKSFLSTWKTKSMIDFLTSWASFGKTVKYTGILYSL